LHSSRPGVSRSQAVGDDQAAIVPSRSGARLPVSSWYSRIDITAAAPSKRMTAASRRTGKSRRMGCGVGRLARASLQRGAEDSSERRSSWKRPARSWSLDMGQEVPESSFSAIVVNSRAAHGDVERFGGFLDRHAELEDELQDLALAA